jgi:hypothetical protein
MPYTVFPETKDKFMEIMMIGPSYKNTIVVSLSSKSGTSTPSVKVRKAFEADLPVAPIE